MMTKEQRIQELETQLADERKRNDGLSSLNAAITRKAKAQRYPGGPPTGWRTVTRRVSCTTGKAAPHQIVVCDIPAVTFCSCPLGSWKRAKEQERRSAA